MEPELKDLSNEDIDQYLQSYTIEGCPDDFDGFGAGCMENEFYLEQKYGENLHSKKECGGTELVYGNYSGQVIDRINGDYIKMWQELTNVCLMKLKI